LFGAVAFFSLVIMYDATGIRRAAGRQAAILNRMLDELKDYHKLEPVRLKELLGHTPMEVFVGAAYGTSIALLLHP
jgi:acid phosphatase family membrane protein YuiD